MRQILASFSKEMKSLSKQWVQTSVVVKKQKYLVNWIEVKSWREKTLKNATSNRIIAIMGREEGGDDATEAGGGNLHRGRGATAWGREDGGDDATEAGGGNLHSNSDLPIYPDLESLSVPKTPIEKTRQTLFTFY